MVECRSPRAVVCGLRGGSGKSVVTLGLIGALKGAGLNVVPFKKGPDYIDPAWLSLAAGTPCHNLDSFFFDRAEILRLFEQCVRCADVAVIEGNRGLFDGMDSQGSHSTAELAKLLHAPVILVVDCTKVSRTAAAMVLGCRTMDPDLNIAGVVLNSVVGSRQENVIRGAIESVCDIPVLGSIPRIHGLTFSMRHLGLVPPPEHPDAVAALSQAVDAVQKHLDLDRVKTLATSVPALEIDSPAKAERDLRYGGVRIGVVRDAAFNFYYPENIEDLERRGAEIVEIDALSDEVLPETDALYIGGGFPETHAAALADNRRFRADLKRRIEHGLPVLAECGGLVYLCRELIVDDVAYPMVGVFPVAFDVAERPQGHGYAVAVVERENPFFEPGLRLRGHEFRYSRVRGELQQGVDMAFRMERGYGFDGGRDGLCKGNVLASFCHFHSRSVTGWAEGLVRCAAEYRNRRNGPVELTDELLYDNRLVFASA